MKCPYCATAFNIEWNEDTQLSEEVGGYTLYYEFCPECGRFMVGLQHGKKYTRRNGEFGLLDIDFDGFIYPQYPNGEVLNEAIPEQYIQLYKESEQVSYISPRASATLSRYLLQMILHEELGIKKRNLEEEISELENRNNIPSELVTMLQVMRKVANFGAHPKKSTNSNEIMEVEKGECDVMLQLLRELFDYQFVKPKQQADFLRQIQEKYGIQP